ncbi:hypothetical protein HMPREF9997_02677 [Corynebacterium durum F0235]|jgi:hypothetical protein|uniref:Uncharacterized protein n=1 Tax=Corynebacterium durum F0235 TaxID=1035195 RepID=L1MA89_9CORY|nr:hypothetical protein HMPREF9997_02677 [Corynebacterium durum F0235]
MHVWVQMQLFFRMSQLVKMPLLLQILWLVKDIPPTIVTAEYQLP